jgi:phosphoribosyl 1,2-cyclic phosphodiesterase
VKLRFWGVRGSFAMSGRDYLRYGGNTTSIEFVTAAGERLLVDLGTGATELAKELMTTEFGKGAGRLPILLTHTHLDHIQGLPFFTPFFIKGNEIQILGADPISGLSLEATLQNQLSPHYSPLNGLENLAAGVTIKSFVPGSSLSVPGFAVTTAKFPHGSMWTTGLRIAADQKVVAVLTDVEYPSPDEPLPDALALAEDADLLVHDAQLLAEELPAEASFGHAAAEYAVRLAVRANARRLVLFHHKPSRTDAELDDVARRFAAAEIPVTVAVEGTTMEL